MSIRESIKGAIGQVTSYEAFLDEHANNFIVRPFSAQGVGGFVFSIKDTDRIELRADITDYVVEDNSSVQDHIAIKPLNVTLRGFIGEVTNEVISPTIGQTLSVIQNVLTEVDAYLPLFSLGGLEAAQRAEDESFDTVKELDKAIKAAQNLAGTVGVAVPGISVQERTYSNLQAMFKSRQVVTVETPWGYFDNMAITSVITEQDGKTNQISDITITLKQLKFAKVEIAVFSKSGRAEGMSALSINKGKIKGEEILSLATSPWASADPGNQKDAFNYIFSPTGGQ